MKLLLATLLLLVGLYGCSGEHSSNHGFSLPQGDVENGELVFIDMNCIECHVIAGSQFNGEQWVSEENQGIAVVLGGETAKVQTYGDLVTSIINPSHRIAKGYPADKVIDEDGQSEMAYYNEVMTVAELVDLVTFLESKYKFKSYPKTNYSTHPSDRYGVKNKAD